MVLRGTGGGCEPCSDSTYIVDLLICLQAIRGVMSPQNQVYLMTASLDWHQVLCLSHFRYSYADGIFILGQYLIRNYFRF